MFEYLKSRIAKADDNTFRLIPNIQDDLTAFELINLPALMVMPSAQSYTVTHDDWNKLKEKCPNIERHFLIEGE